MKKTVQVFPIKKVTNSVLFLYFPLEKMKNRNQDFTKLVFL